jgi:hypothetical protein
VVSISLMCHGCATSPYVPRPPNEDFGYSEIELAEGHYWVGYETRKGGTQLRADLLVAKRAGELCEGKYTELPPDLDVMTLRSCDSHPHAPCSTALAQLWIKCEK